jgi:hypothetical protein
MLKTIPPFLGRNGFVSAVPPKLDNLILSLLISLTQDLRFNLLISVQLNNIKGDNIYFSYTKISASIWLSKYY